MNETLTPPAAGCSSAAELRELEKRVSALEQRQSAYDTAFLRDDLGRPGFDDHRRDHAQQRRAAETLDGYKQDGTKTVLKALIGAVLAVLLLGLGEWIRSRGG